MALAEMYNSSKAGYSLRLCKPIDCHADKGGISNITSVILSRSIGMIRNLKLFTPFNIRHRIKSDILMSHSGLDPESKKIIGCIIRPRIESGVTCYITSAIRSRCIGMTRNLSFEFAHCDLRSIREKLIQKNRMRALVLLCAL